MKERIVKDPHGKLAQACGNRKATFGRPPTPLAPPADDHPLNVFDRDEPTEALRQ